jgi:hypothetical protein
MVANRPNVATNSDHARAGPSRNFWETCRTASPNIRWAAQTPTMAATIWTAM